MGTDLWHLAQQGLNKYGGDDEVESMKQKALQMWKYP